LARAARFLLEPGISVVNAPLASAGVGDVVHAHPPAPMPCSLPFGPQAFR
jgi:hypothetical protein